MRRLSLACILTFLKVSAKNIHYFGNKADKTDKTKEKRCR